MCGRGAPPRTTTPAPPGSAAVRNAPRVRSPRPLRAHGWPRPGPGGRCRPWLAIQSPEPPAGRCAAAHSRPAPPPPGRHAPGCRHAPGPPARRRRGPAARPGFARPAAAMAAARSAPGPGRPARHRPRARRCDAAARRWAQSRRGVHSPVCGRLPPPPSRMALGWLPRPPPPRPAGRKPRPAGRWPPRLRPPERSRYCVSCKVPRVHGRAAALIPASSAPPPCPSGRCAGAPPARCPRRPAPRTPQPRRRCAAGSPPGSGTGRS